MRLKDCYLVSFAFSKLFLLWLVGGRTWEGWKGSGDGEGVIRQRGGHGKQQQS